MNIYRALLKHGHPNFELTIIEYCEVSDLLIREKHYWGIFTPEYNIAQDPTAPMSGRTHSDATKIIMSDAHKGRNHSEESKIIMSDAKKGENHPNYGKTLNNETKTKISKAHTGKTHDEETKKNI